MESLYEVVAYLMNILFWSKQLLVETQQRIYWML